MGKLVALVPMKGHSERVPDKNIRDFNGKPLLYWIINELKKSDYVKKIIVNTDSEQIAKLCKSFFSEVLIIDRPEELCGDFVSMNRIIKHEINQFSSNDYFLQTHCTNPLLTVDTIDEAIATFFEKRKDGYNSLFSVNKIQTRCYNSNGDPINHNCGELKRTQDLNPIYEENSNMYIFSRKSFKRNNFNRIGEKPYLFEMDRVEAIDIDEEDDFILAKKLHKLRSE